VSSCRADHAEGFVSLIAMAVADAARRIEAENFRQAFPNARIVVAPVAERAGPGLLAVDADDLVIGATRAARLAFDITCALIAQGLPAGDLIGGVEAEREDFSAAERALVRRTLARAHGNVSKAAKALGVSRATLHRKLIRLDLHHEG